MDREHSRSRKPADQFAGLLQNFYRGLLDQGVPPHMAALVRQLESGGNRTEADPRRIALVVESDHELRSFAATLLEETDLAVLECTSAEAALAVLQTRASEIVFVFADENLSGPRTGWELARSARTLWPHVHIVVTTSEAPGERHGLPDDVVLLTKPWRSLDVLYEAEVAVADGEPHARIIRTL